MSLVSYVIERISRGEYFHDTHSKLLKEKIIFLGGEVNDASTSLVVAQPLFLELENPGKDTHLYVNSPGGSVSAGFAVYDTMSYIRYDVSTACIGMVASMGTFPLSGGAKDKHFVLSNTEIMIHQPSGEAKGQATEVKVVAENILKAKEKLNEILVANTGKPLEVVERDTGRGNYMSALEAREYGLTSGVIAHHQCCSTAPRHQTGNVKKQVKDMKGQASYINETE